MFTNILVPLDGSINSQKALTFAIKLARKFSSSLTLLSVVDNRDFSGSIPAANAATPIIKDEEISQLVNYANKVIDDGLKTVKENGLDAKTLVKKGYPKAIIATDTPKEENIDLIVMGKSGRGALDRLLIGSTTAYVVRNTNVQVLVVNAG